MLYQELPHIESTPLDGWGRWLVPSIIGAAGLTASFVLIVLGYPLTYGVVILVIAAIAAIAAVLLRWPASRPASLQALAAGPHYSLVGSTLSLSRDPVALTNGEGSLLVVNNAYRERFDTS